MASQTISVKNPKAEREFTGEYDFGDTLESAVEKFGAEVIFSQFKGASVVTLQGNIRRQLSVGKTEEEVAAFVAGWSPGVAVVRSKASTQDKANDYFNSLDEDGKVAFIDKLRAQM